MKRLIILLVLMVAMTVTADSHTTVTLVLSSDPQTLDPQGRPHPSHAAILPYIYDTLVYQDENGLIQPFLAESWSASEDGLSVTFVLKPDVVFSNGSPVNADAVIYTFQRLQAQGQTSLIYNEISNIAGFEKIDDLTVRFDLTEPSASLLSALSYAFAGILDPEATEAGGEAYGLTPVGSGAFMLADWVQGNSITLVANPNYSGHRPTGSANDVAELQIRFTSDEAMRVNALLSGEVDIAFLSSAPQLDRIAEDATFTVLESPSRGMVILGVNTERVPLDVRQIIAQAIDKQIIVDIAVPGLAVPVDSPIPPSIYGYNGDLVGMAYDPEAARAALETVEVGTLTILTSTYPTNQTIATIIQAQLSEIGIDAEIEVLDFAASREAASAGDYDLLVTNYNWNDPDLLRLYLSTESISAPNYYFYSNADFDALVQQGRTTYDDAARYEIYTQAQQIVMEELPWIPLYMPITKVVVNNRIANVSLLNTHVVLDSAQIEGNNE